MNCVSLKLILFALRLALAIARRKEVRRRDRLFRFRLEKMLVFVGRRGEGIDEELLACQR